jgi:hypothetical protein
MFRGANLEEGANNTVVESYQYRSLRSGRPKMIQNLEQQRSRNYFEIFQKDNIYNKMKQNFGRYQVANQASLYSEKFQKDKNYNMRQNFLSHLSVLRVWQTQPTLSRSYYVLRTTVYMHSLVQKKKFKIAPL